MMRKIPVICIIAFCSSCNATGVAKSDSPGADTTVLIQKDTSLVTGSAPLTIQLSFPENSKTKYDSSGKTWLLLDNIQVVSDPDGVYEIYLTKEKPAPGSLLSQNPAFVNVLDLYPLTLPDTKNQLAVEISQHIRKWFLPEQNKPSIFATIMFRGTQLPNGSFSVKSGEIKINGVSIIQTK